MARELGEVEGEMAYVEEIGGLHTALLKTDPETGIRYYLDPFLLQKEAINLTAILSSRTSRAFSVLPQLKTEAQPRIEVRPGSGSVVSTTLYYSPYNDSEYVAFLFDLSRATPNHPPLTKKRLANGRPPEFVLRLLNEDNGTTTLAYDLTTRTYKIRKKGGKVLSRHYGENISGFEAEREIILQRVNLTWDRLREAVNEAWEICRSLPAEEKRVF